MNENNNELMMDRSYVDFDLSQVDFAGAYEDCLEEYNELWVKEDYLNKLKENNPNLFEYENYQVFVDEMHNLHDRMILLRSIRRLINKYWNDLPF